MQSLGAKARTAADRKPIHMRHTLKRASFQAKGRLQRLAVEEEGEQRPTSGTVVVVGVTGALPCQCCI